MFGLIVSDPRLCYSILIRNIKENNTVTNYYYFTINITNIYQNMVVYYYTITDLNTFVKYNFTIYIANSIKKEKKQIYIMFSE